MRRQTFLSATAFFPVLLDSLWSQFCKAEQTTAPEAVQKKEVTIDIYEGDFPPVRYGQTLSEVEATIQQVVERVFRDQDGILRSGVNGRTMKALTAGEVKDRPNGRGAHTQNSAIPDSLKAVWMNYENAGEASGTYLEALCNKAKVTGDPKLRELARSTVEGIVTLWNNAAPPAGLGGGGRGWFPKPYGGIRSVAGIDECSADQYAVVTLGLHSYHLSLADETEKKKIEDVISSFSDWWYDHDYAGIYFGKPIWWKRLGWHPMAEGFFLYLHALADSWRPSDKSRQGFETWLRLKATLLQPPADKPTWVDMHGIPLKCLDRLMALRPDLNEVWRPAVDYQSRLLAKGVEGVTGFTEHNSKPFAADYLAIAHRMTPGAGYDKLAVSCLQDCMRRENFYYLRRGLNIDRMSSLMKGDDCRDVFWCENHVHWMNAYWNLRRSKSIA